MRADSGGRVDQDEVGIGLHARERAKEALGPVLVQVRQLLHAAARGHDADPLGPLEHDVLDAAVPQDRVLEVVLGRDAEQEVHVREPEIAVQHQHARSLSRERDREVRHDVRLAHASLPARHRDHLAARARLGRGFGMTSRERGAGRLLPASAFGAAFTYAALRDDARLRARHESQIPGFAWHDRPVLQSVCRGVKPLISLGLTAFPCAAPRLEPGR